MATPLHLRDFKQQLIEAENMAKKKAARKTAAPLPEGFASQKELVLAIIKAIGDDKPAKIKEYAQTKYNYEFTGQSINQVKNGLKKVGGGKTVKKVAMKRGPRAKRSAVPMAPVAAAASDDVVAATIELVRLVGVDKAEALLATLRK